MPIMLTSNEDYLSKNYERALTDIFVEIDYLLVNEEGHEKMQEVLLELKREVRGPTAKLDMAEIREIKSLPFAAGCTSCVCLITPDTIYCANSGDSRAILVNKAGKVTELSHDHKVTSPREQARIAKLGLSNQVRDGRLFGVLAVSRSFGDVALKVRQTQALEDHQHHTAAAAAAVAAEPSATPPAEGVAGGEGEGEGEGKAALIAVPEVMRVRVRSEDEFVVVASDGVWDVLSSQKVLNFVRRRLLAHRCAQRAANELVEEAINMGSHDNTSELVVMLHQVA